MSNLAQRIKGLSPAKLALLSKRLNDAAGKAAIETTIPRRNESEYYPLSYAQQQLWLLDQLEPGNPAYNCPLAVRMEGALDIPALEKSFHEFIRRHEILRTAFRVVEGQPAQFISDEVRFRLPVIDLRDLDENARKNERKRLSENDARRSFKLTHGQLIRIHLLIIGRDEHVLILALHHIVTDEWSNGVLMRELSVLYRAFSAGVSPALPALPIQYVDYAQWQRSWLKEDVIQEDLSYWKKQLSGAPPIFSLPTDRPRPLIRSGFGNTYSLTLPEDLSLALRDLGRRFGVTLYMVLLTAFKILLNRYSQEEDILVGAPVAGRDLIEIEGLMGYFANTLVLRTDLSGSPTFLEALERVRNVVLDAHEHRRLPFVMIVNKLRPERKSTHTALFQIAFAFDDSSGGASELPSLKFSSDSYSYGMAKFDLTLVMTELGKRIGGSFEYSSELFDDATIARLASHFKNLLGSMVANPDQPITRLSMLGQAERRQVIEEWGRSLVEYPREATLVSLFEGQVERAPEAIALRYEAQSLSYRELNARANQLAHHLQRLGVGPEVVVSLFLDRSSEMVVAILGILKAGGGYLPIDLNSPPERLAYLLHSSSSSLLLTQRSLLKSSLPPQIHHLCMDSDWSAIAQAPTTNPESRVVCDNVAYVIYTSGSTGQPKGVIVSHANVARLMEATRAWFEFNEEDVWTLFHSYAFDFSVWELWGALLYGGRLVVTPYLISRSPEEFRQLLCNEKVSVLNQTPSAFYQLMRADQEAKRAERLSLRLIIFGGEALEVRKLTTWFEQYGEETPQLINMYGITETTVHVTYRRIFKADMESGPGSMIGRVMPDLQIYMLDGAIEPEPVGVAGELYVGGGGLARGYLNMPELTAERFMPHPFSPTPGARLYRTGDLARYRAEGELEYLGRCDQQVKIRGHRIELGEIESVLMQHPGVQEAIVVAREYEPGDKRLVAYLVPDSEHALTIRQILRLERQGLLSSKYELPNNMVISQLNKGETDFMYKEIFEERTYAQHGVTLKGGDCIFDVGANIGLFTLFAGLECRNSVIYAFEPIPAVFDALRINTELYGLNVRLFNFGLSDLPKRKEITYYPNISVVSGLYANDLQQREVIKPFWLNQDRLGDNEGPISNGEMLDELLEARMASERIACEFKTISDVIRENNVERIDLLKIDVEKSELDVLSGIQDSDWQKIRQCVVEVHDINGRLEEIISLFESQGYAVSLQQAALLKDTGLYNVYAIRGPKGESLPGEAGSGSIEEKRPVWHSQGELISDVREFLKSKLPAYMSPAAIVTLDVLPLTSSGKLDRRALPAPDADANARRGYEPPEGEIETRLAQIWAGVLKVERVGRRDNFFELGGDSILSIMIATRANEVGLLLKPRHIFDHQNIADLASAADISGAGCPPTTGDASQLVPTGEGVTPQPSPGLNSRMIERLPSNLGEIEDAYPLSPMQHAMLFQSVYAPDSLPYFSQSVCVLPESLDVEAFRWSWRQAMERHPILRTAFIWERVEKPFQVVIRNVDLPWEEVDWSDLSPDEYKDRFQNFLRVDNARGIELTKAPLFRLALLKTPQNGYELMWSCHHLLIDGWSLNLLIKEIFFAYRTLRAGQTPYAGRAYPYRDYIDWITRQDISRAEQFWRHTLEGVKKATSITSDFRQVEDSDDFYEERDIQLSKAMTESLQSFARRHRLTLNTLVQGAWSLLLSQKSSSDDVVFGVTVSGRPSDLHGTESIMGLFINTLPMRVRVAKDSALLPWLKTLQRNQMEMLQYEYIPLAEIQGWCEAPRGTPLFESNMVFLNLQQDASVREAGRGALFRDVRSKTPTNIPLTLKVHPGKEIGLQLLYDRRRFDVTQITAMLEQVKLLLEGFAANPETKLNLLSDMLKDYETDRQMIAQTERKRSGFNRLLKVKPQVIALSKEALIKTSYLDHEQLTPLVITPQISDMDLVDWAKGNLGFIEHNLQAHGGILFRGFTLDSYQTFDQFVRSIRSELLDYLDQHTPRTRISGNIYTSTEYPADQCVPFHSENSKNSNWPMKIWFFCLRPPQQGGETPIADNRKVFDLLEPGIREKFMSKNVMYVRNFGEGLGLPWQTVFQLSDKAALERYCHSAGIDFEWKSDDRLKIRHISQAVATHPKTCEMVWFNQAHLFHISSLEQKARESLSNLFDEADLPANAYYGDGSPIEDEVVDQIRQAYRAASVKFPWRKGDVLMLDNMLISHSRSPYVGDRQILVAMADLHSNYSDLR